jgi:hypothetical protein
MRRRVESLPGLGSRRSQECFEKGSAGGGRLNMKGLKRVIGQWNRYLGARVSDGPSEAGQWCCGAREGALQEAAGGWSKKRKADTDAMSC